MSSPSVAFPGRAFTNAEILERVRSRFNGSGPEWRKVEAGIRHVFERCNSRVRFLEEEPGPGPGALAAGVAAECLTRHGVEVAELDLVVYGGIAREAYEPATAAEVAGRLGCRAVHAFDVTCACAGVLEALHAVAAHFALHPGVRTALVCSAELTRDRISYDVQSLEDLEVRAAGLTLGNAAAAFLVSREPLRGGSARVLALRQRTLPTHWALCTAPIDGVFTSRSRELFELSVHVAPELDRLLADVGWGPLDVDHFLFHQPSDSMVIKVPSELGADPARAVLCHSRFGNTASTSALVAFDQCLRERSLRGGDQLVFASAAAGFTIACAAAVWDG